MSSLLPEPLTPLEATTDLLPMTRLTATYPAVPWACPERIDIEWADPGARPTNLDIADAIAALARVPANAHIYHPNPSPPANTCG